MPASTYRDVNPFEITKAVHLDDAQIQQLWVSVPGQADDFVEFARPTSPMPTYIMGAKGSGKTHLMRYHSFELQILRYRSTSKPLRDGIRDDGYLGIYNRLGGLNSGRFSGRGQSIEKWSDLYAYYMELWLVQSVLSVMEVLEVGSLDGDEEALCSELLELFDKPPMPQVRRVRELRQALNQVQRDVDFAITNCVMSGSLDVPILFTRSRLLFGLPKLLARRYNFLSKVLFVYSLDEFENIPDYQQKFINTLVRETELPSTIRIGSRLYGVKTHETLSDNEENLQDSEYRKLSLDALFRSHKNKYADFAKDIIDKRLESELRVRNTSRGTKIGSELSLDFEKMNLNWNSKEVLSLFSSRTSSERVHLANCSNNLQLYGMSKSDAEAVVERLREDRFPILEKVGVLNIYQDLFRKKDIIRSSARIEGERAAYLVGQGKGTKFSDTLSHYKNDLLAQILAENDERINYFGLETFIDMSVGLPRGLLTILRSIYEWSYFSGEAAAGTKVSRQSQSKGVKQASDWFYENMRKAGADGTAIQSAIDRLARLFQINRFADKPTDCSMISFSYAEDQVSDEARRIIRLAEGRSFINRIEGGQKDKNSERTTIKYQINSMLSPRWDLSIGRRGTHPFSGREIDDIFDLSRSSQFDEFLIDWRARRTAPFFQRRIGQSSRKNQQELF